MAFPDPETIGDDPEAGEPCQFCDQLIRKADRASHKVTLENRATTVTFLSCVVFCCDNFVI
jgi:hypothetical protein